MHKGPPRCRRLLRAFHALHAKHGLHYTQPLNRGAALPRKKVMTKITLEDDLGNVQVIEGQEALDHILFNHTTQDFFTPCMGCDKIVLYSHADFSENGPFCKECVKE